MIFGIRGGLALDACSGCRQFRVALGSLSGLWTASINGSMGFPHFGCGAASVVSAMALENYHFERRK